MFDSIQFWIYVIAIVLYLIGRGRKKKQTPDPQDEEVTRPMYRPESREPHRELTFEELLREISEAKKPKEPAPVTPYAGYVEEEEDLEDVDFDYGKDDETVRAYEEAKLAAYQSKSLEETMSLDDTNTDFGRFSEFEETRQPTIIDEYIKELRTPQGFKKAIVMSEILQRRF